MAALITPFFGAATLRYRTCLANSHSRSPSGLPACFVLLDKTQMSVMQILHGTLCRAHPKKLVGDYVGFAVRVHPSPPFATGLCDQNSVNGERSFLRCTGTRHGPALVFESGYGGTADDWYRRRLVNGPKGAATRGGMWAAEEAGTDTRSQPKMTSCGSCTYCNGRSSATVCNRGAFVWRDAGTTLLQSDPSDVAGKVFVDSAHEEAIWRFQAIAPNSIRRISESSLLLQGFLAPNPRLHWHNDIPLVVI